jgi:hypothetical protein
MTHQAAGGQYLDMARWFTAGWFGNVAPAGDRFTKTDRTNGAVAGVAGRNAGYKSDGRASLVLRELSRTCSQPTIKTRMTWIAGRLIQVR